jgi:hypothetical protein
MCDSWTVRNYERSLYNIYKVDERRLISGEMLSMRGDVGCIFSDCRRTEEIITELHVSQRTGFIKQYRFGKDTVTG